MEERCELLMRDACLFPPIPRLLDDNCYIECLCGLVQC